MDKTPSHDLALAADSPLIQQTLAAWSERAKAGLASATQSALKSDWRIFAAWCQAQGRTPLPATPETVAAFLDAESEPAPGRKARAVATIKRRASTISIAHRAAGLANPCDTEVMRLTLKGISRRLGTNQRQARGLLKSDADKIEGIVKGNGGGLRDVRDLALVLVGRDLLARASELISIAVDAVEWDATDDTAIVLLRRHKTDTEAKPCMIGPDAAAALRKWLDAAGITEGVIFRRVTQRGRLKPAPMSRQDVGLAVRRLTGKLTVPGGYSAHSLRVGMAQDMMSANIEVGAIAQAGHWKSLEMPLRYTAKLSQKRGAVARFHGLLKRQA